jgi:hypothetical protein
VSARFLACIDFCCQSFLVPPRRSVEISFPAAVFDSAASGAPCSAPILGFMHSSLAGQIHFLVAVFSFWPPPARSGLPVPIPSTRSRLGAPVCAASEDLVVLLRFSVREPEGAGRLLFPFSRDPARHGFISLGF